MDILRPYMLLFMPILIVMVLFSSKYIGKIRKGRKNTILMIRCLVFIFLTLALAGISLIWKVNTTTTMFVVDASHSMMNYKSDVEKFVRDAVSKKGNFDKVGVVSFGSNAVVEDFISDKVAFNKIEGGSEGSYTNIENALMQTRALMPDDSKKRIVLLTDGEENIGRASKVASMLQGVDFKVYKINREVHNEASIESITIPETLREGQEFNIVVNVMSTTATKAKLTLFNDRDKGAGETVELNKGENKFVFTDVAKGSSFKNYKALIEPLNDTEIKNNEASAFTNIKSKPKILVIEDILGEALEIEKMLKSSNMDYNKVNAKGAPNSIGELVKYKSIIACNVSAENLNSKFLNVLETYVKELGGGFIATGGKNSFALGGYFKTPLEKILPVNMDLKGKKEIPSMAMLLIIDKSGSMTSGAAGLSKLDLAKEAAARSLDSLRNKDEIGVLTFDDTLYWVVERQKIKNKENIRGAIGTIRAGGGTSILPALEKGYKSLKDSNAKIKHIILLTDGQAEQSGFNKIVNDINNNNITVSTVAIGRDSDRNLLETIAKGAKGRFYYSDDPSNIPQIFAKESFMATRAYLNNEKFTPVISDSHPILNGVVDNGLPPLLGYIGASPKSTARVLLKSNEDDPILTVWQYGLGKTATWNSDINGKWSAEFIKWSNNIKLWNHIIDFTVENYENSDSKLELKIEGGKGIATLHTNNPQKSDENKAIIISPSMKNTEIILYPISKNKYTGSFDIKETGTYIVKSIQKYNGTVVNAASNGLGVQYSPEYKIITSQSSLDPLIKELTGNYITSPQQVYKGKLEDIVSKRDMTQYFLVIALLLFIFDIVNRKINLPFKKLHVLMENFIAVLKIRVITNNNKKTNSNEAYSSVTSTSNKEEYEEEYNDAKEKNKEKVTQLKSDMGNIEKVKNTKSEESLLDTSSLLKNKQRKKY